MYVSRFLHLSVTGVEPQQEAPAAGRLLAGTPKFTSWNVEEAEGGLFAGVWEATPGKWRVEYDEWEFCHILAGVSVLTEDGGEARMLKAGDSFIIRPGFKGTWEVVETTRKEYVIRS